MTLEEYKKARQDYENNKKRVEEEGLKLDEQFAKVSKEYFDNLVSLECGEYYMIDLTYSYDMCIYFKWNEYCGIKFRKDIADFCLSIDKAIIIHKGDISIYHNYNYSTSPDRVMRDLHKINSSTIEDVIAYIKQKIKNFRKMPISKEKLKEMKKYNFHRISENDTEGKTCATCDYGTSLMCGNPAYCYKTGLKIDYDFICNGYKIKE